MAVFVLDPFGMLIIKCRPASNRWNIFYSLLFDYHEAADISDQQPSPDQQRVFFGSYMLHMSVCDIFGCLDSGDRTVRV